MPAPVFDAFHLPASLAAPRIADGRPAGDGGLTLRLPQVDADLLQSTLAALRQAGHTLRRRPVADIVATLDAAGRRFAADGADRTTAMAWLPAVTGFSPPMVALALDWVAGLLQAPVLQALLQRELGDPRLLDGLQARTDAPGRTRAHGPQLTALVLSGNVPGVPAWSLASALLLKSPCLAKTAHDEPVFAVLLARAVAAVDPALGDALAVLPWRGGDPALEAVVLAQADALVTYGGDDALDSLRRRTPASTRFVGYGHKLSFAVVDSAAATRDDTAASAARDVAMFDQQGCVSPHVVYVEGDADTALAFAHRMAHALQALQQQLPRGRITVGEAAAIQRLRGQHELRSALDRRCALLCSPGGTDWTVLVDHDPVFEASCLNRTVRVKPLPDLNALPAAVQGITRWLQTVGVAVAPQRLAALAEALSALGATRLCALGSMAEPPAHWRHDGRPSLLDLVRWTDTP